jgi:hypothetical protein
MQANSHGAGSSSVTRITQRLEALSLCYCFVFTAISADIRGAGGAAHEGFRGLRSASRTAAKVAASAGRGLLKFQSERRRPSFPGPLGRRPICPRAYPNDYRAFPSVADLTAPAFCPVSVRRLRARRPFPPLPAPPLGDAVALGSRSISKARRGLSSPTSKPCLAHNKGAAHGHALASRSWRPRAAARIRCRAAYPCRASLARVQSWPPQNNPPKTQPSTRSTSAPLSEMFEA